jgi:hypothetical protein
VGERRRRDAEAAEEASQRAQELGAAWDRHQAGESMLQILFGWLPPVARKRLAGARAAYPPTGKVRCPIGRASLRSDRPLQQL